MSAPGGHGYGGGGPGTTATAPGWYPDPDGIPGMLRWWNGVGWSDVTTPAGPGVTVAGGSYAWQPAPAPAPPPTAARPRRTAQVVGSLGLVLLVVVVIAVVLVSRGGSTPTPTPTAAPATSEGSTFPPGTVRITDAESGISYPFLGNGWYEYDLQGQVETSSIAGQYFITQDLTPDGTQFIAQCTSGPLLEGLGYAGPGTLAATLETVTGSVRSGYYPGPNEMEVRRDEARTVDGAPAHLIEFDLSWDVEGYDASGERAALLLIDVGRAVPALLYISIPNTHAELYGVIDRVLDDVDVL